VAGGDKGTSNTRQDGAHRFGAHIFCLPGFCDLVGRKPLT